MCASGVIDQQTKLLLFLVRIAPLNGHSQLRSLLCSFSTFDQSCHRRLIIMSTQLERAIEQMQIKETVNIDFTQHMLDDGTIVNTQERVVKDVCCHQSPNFSFNPFSLFL